MSRLVLSSEFVSLHRVVSSVKHSDNIFHHIEHSGIIVLLISIFVIFLFIFTSIEVYSTRKIGETTPIAQFTVGNDVSSWNAWRTGELSFPFSFCGLLFVYFTLENYLHCFLGHLWVYFAVTSGMWAGKESCIDGVHNRWIGSISNSGIFGRMGYWEFWGSCFWSCLSSQFSVCLLFS